MNIPCLRACYVASLGWFLVAANITASGQDQRAPLAGQLDERMWKLEIRLSEDEFAALEPSPPRLAFGGQAPPQGLPRADDLPMRWQPKVQSVQCFSNWSRGIHSVASARFACIQCSSIPRVSIATTAVFDLRGSSRTHHLVDDAPLCQRCDGCSPTLIASDSRSVLDSWVHDHRVCCACDAH